MSNQNIIALRGRDCIIGRADVKPLRHDSDPKLDQTQVIEAFEWVNDNRPVIISLDTNKTFTASEVATLIKNVRNSSIFDMHAFYSVGETPEAAIRAYGDHHGWGVIEGLTEQTPDGPYQWYYTFTSDGTNMKAAGVYVTGGVILTWWS